jgi:hypothetical protein
VMHPPELENMYYSIVGEGGGGGGGGGRGGTE